MSIREKPIYISNEVGRWLWLLSKAEKGIQERETTLEGTRYPTQTTPDEIADQILRQAIREQHPQLAEHDKALQQLEKQTIESLRTNEIEQKPRT